MLSYQKYKPELQKAAEKKTESTRELKRKQKFDEIENIKKQKLTLQKTMIYCGRALKRKHLEADKIRILVVLQKLLHFYVP